MSKTSSTSKNINRRQYIRVTPQLQAPIRVDINGAGIVEVMKAVDIGEGGICIRVAHRFGGVDIDEPVSFIIYLPQPINEFFRVEGNIKHVRNDFFGVKFINLNERSRAMIRSYVGQRLKERGLWAFIKYSLGLIR